MKYEAYDLKPRGYNANPLMNETVVNKDMWLAPGTEVFGVALGDQSAAWTLEAIRAAKKIDAHLGTAPLTILWDESLQAPALEGPFAGISMRAYWYAWSSFYPKTKIESPKEKNP